MIPTFTPTCKAVGPTGFVCGGALPCSLHPVGAPAKVDVMTDNDLKALEDRYDAATPGPWNKSTDSWDDETYSVIRDPNGAIVLQVPTRVSVYPSGSFITVEGQEADIDFAVHAHEDVPKLIAEIRRLRKERN